MSDHPWNDDPKPEPLTPEEVGVLVKMIKDQREEIARLRSKQSLLAVLREIALDPSVPPHVRLKAAEVGVGYETPKLTANISAGLQLSGIGNRLDALTKAQERGLRLVGPGPDDAA
jgi:hypothetical protein